MSTIVLLGLGLAMLAVGVWVEDRAAVAAPLVIIGALVVVGGVIFEAWADLEELSISQAGVTLRRRPPPSAEELAEAGLPPEVAKRMSEWFDSLLGVLPEIIDRRVNKRLAEIVRGANTSATSRRGGPTGLGQR